MKFKIAKQIGFLCICLLISSTVTAQRASYKKDSLQIKVYSEITYKNSRVESIKITRTFCDYCSESQKDALKKEAWNHAYAMRNSKKNRLKDGIKKLALYIRVSKKDFLNLKKQNNIPK